jgi:hypothetical protein
LESGRDAISAVSSRLDYTIWDEERPSKVTIRNEEGGQTNTQKYKKLAGTSTKNVIRKSSEATFIYYLPIERREQKTKKKMA